MPEPTAYEIVIRGRASARILRPFVDEFTVDHSRLGVTRLLGTICDASQLHGLMAHLTSVGAEVISIAPVTPEPITLPPSSTPTLTPITPLAGATDPDTTITRMS